MHILFKMEDLIELLNKLSSFTLFSCCGGSSECSLTLSGDSIILRCEDMETGKIVKHVVKGDVVDTG